VLRQPFGGMGSSSLGPGMKAGGPNYLACFLDVAETAVASVPDTTIADRFLAALADRLPDDLTGHRLRQALASYDRVWREEFSREHDHFRLLGQDNIRRYLPFPTITVRITAADSWFDIVARVAAGRSTGARVVASLAPECPAEWHDALNRLTICWAGALEILEQADDAVRKSAAN
jgi:RHH-type proline utilization regulon transcriptional repressor/proline dehydrogenase/delta 1-pyrroline-5-carboxylate dehydrogenase